MVNPNSNKWSDSRFTEMCVCVCEIVSLSEIKATLSDKLVPREIIDRNDAASIRYNTLTGHAYLPDFVGVGDLQSNVKRGVVDDQRRLTSSQPPTQHRPVTCITTHAVVEFEPLVKGSTLFWSEKPLIYPTANQTSSLFQLFISYLTLFLAIGSLLPRATIHFTVPYGVCVRYSGRERTVACQLAAYMHNASCTYTHFRLERKVEFYHSLILYIFVIKSDILWRCGIWKQALTEVKLILEMRLYDAHLTKDFHSSFSTVYMYVRQPPRRTLGRRTWWSEVVPGKRKVRCDELLRDVRRYSCLSSSMDVLLSTLTGSPSTEDLATSWSTRWNLLMFLWQPSSRHVDVLYENGLASVTVVMTTPSAPPGECNRHVIQSSSMKKVKLEIIIIIRTFITVTVRLQLQLQYSKEKFVK